MFDDSSQARLRCLPLLCDVYLRASLLPKTSKNENHLEEKGVQHLLPTVDECRSLDPQDVITRILRYLQQATPCFAAGLLLVNNGHGQIVLDRSRPVDDLFLQGLQQKMMDSYRVYAGSAAPEVRVTVHGSAIGGPYEPPRSVLTVPILSEGRVIGMLAIASVYPDAFSGEDLCKLSTLATQASAPLDWARRATYAGSEAK